MLSALQDISTKIQTSETISRDEAFFLHENADLATLQQLATSVKARFHPRDQATYLVMAIINYTNICVANCDFCAFFRFPHQQGTYLLTTAEVLERVEHFRRLDATLIAFNGGFNPQLRIDHYARLFETLHKTYGEQLTFFEMTVAEFMFACKVSKVSYAAGARLLCDAGTGWITGGGAEVLTDSFRERHSRGKYTVSDYYDAQQAILAAGIGSTATMVIGFDESLDERLEHLDQLRAFQSANANALTSFLCWTYKPEHNRLGGKEISAADYWRWLAICRIFLDNFVHIRTSVLTQNDAALRGLDFGANDFDVPLEDEVTRSAGATIAADYRATLAAARRLGYQPRLRLPWNRHDVAPPATWPAACGAPETHTAATKPHQL